MSKNLFKSDWYHSQNDATKAYLDRTAIWHDSDLLLAVFVGLILGFFLGAIIV